MPPRRRKREDQIIAGLLKKLGVNVDGQQGVGNILKEGSAHGNSNHFIGESYTDKIARVRRELEMAEQRVELEAESVLYFISTRGKGFADKICEECQKPFAATYAAVAYCSNICRYASLAKRGIAWNIYGKTDEERWGGKIPKVLSPEAYKAALTAVENMEEEPEPLEEELEENLIDPEEEEFEIRIQEIVAGGDEEE